VSRMKHLFVIKTASCGFFLSFFFSPPFHTYLFCWFFFSFSYFIVSNIKLACFSEKYHFLVLTTDR
jgi:hypothetical protein